MNTTTEATRDRSRCPSCGDVNQCGFKATSPCWCASPKLGRVQPDATVNTCLCRQCLERLLAEQRGDAT